MNSRRWTIRSVRENKTPYQTDETLVVTLPTKQMNVLLNKLFKKKILKSAFNSTGWGKRFKQIYLSPSQAVTVPSLYQAILEWREKEKME